MRAIQNRRGSTYTSIRYSCCVLYGTGVLLGGCAVFGQHEDVALIREPGQRHYGAPAPVSESAQRLWEYAVLSSNVYYGNWQIEQMEAAMAAKSQEPPADADPYVKACMTSPTGSLPLDGWMLWQDFPSEGLRSDAVRLGLFIEVWERSAIPQTVAVVFKGTEFDSVLDWKSNLRWFTRFIPNYEDQYTLLAKRLGGEFVEEFVKRKLSRASASANEHAVRLIATGHSLGGGLAQHFAYSLPLSSNAGIETPRVSHVYAFDPSPVTGWYSVDEQLRARNAIGLQIDRIFEHGEILAYLRLIQSYVFPPSDANPAIREIRYNFVRSANLFRSHSMLQLACDLARARNSASKTELRGE